jgi:hypothetical protein
MASRIKFPVGSTNLIGLFLAYAYRLKVCGSSGLCTNQSGVINLPSVGSYCQVFYYGAIYKTGTLGRNSRKVFEVFAGVKTMQIATK